VSNKPTKAFTIAFSEGKSLHLSVAEAHQLNIAKRTITMPDAMVGVMGGWTRPPQGKSLGALNAKGRKSILASLAVRRVLNVLLNAA